MADDDRVISLLLPYLVFSLQSSLKRSDCQSLHSSVQETMRSSSSYKHYTDLAILEVVQNNILMVSIILRHFICLPIDGDF